jgi:hypothetical protein
MKKILIISDGDIGKYFIRRIAQTYNSENIYYIVQTKEKIYKDINLSKFKFYEFDPTSLSKLSNILKMEFIQVIIVMENTVDLENTIKNIRLIKKQLRIIVLNRGTSTNKDPNIITMNSNEILSSRLIDYLPNVPVIAQNVGLGKGEIMEVLVPFGSSFIYRHLGAIEQKNWRIVAIYRNKQLLLPNRRRMIQPNDLLLLAGEPSVLKSVYKAIKRELGQFPEPFGSTLYMYIDMNLSDMNTLDEYVKRAIFIHEKFNHNLIIKILNPNKIEEVWKVKEYANENIIVDVKYDIIDDETSFFNDIKNYHVGLVMVSCDMFKNYKIRKMLYEAHVPILKLANKDLDTLKDASLILGNNRDLEKISTTIYDISEQMSLNIDLYNYMSEYQQEKEQVIEHYSNLSAIFSKTIIVHKENENPIITLNEKENFLQFVPFTKKLTQRRIYSILSTDSEKLYHKLDNFHQIFIPVQI